MFKIGDSYSIKRKNTIDLFPEEKLNVSKEEPDFLNEKSSEVRKGDFYYLADHLFGKKCDGAKEEDLYENNGGTTLVVNVDNKLIVAADTRHSSDYEINSRRMTKIYKIGDFYLTVVGFFADGMELHTKLVYQVKQYEMYKKITLKSLAHLLHNILYSRRFFPYYSYATLAGYEDGVAKIYAYDPVGSYEETKCICNGSGSRMIQPLLDSWIMGKNFNNFTGLSFEESIELVKKAFDGAAERDVKTKDFLEMYVIEDGRVQHDVISIRKD